VRDFIRRIEVAAETPAKPAAKPRKALPVA